MLKTPRKERDLTPKEIASQLQISPKTVEVFRQNLLRKGGAKNSVQLVLTARARGWLDGNGLPLQV